MTYENLLLEFHQKYGHWYFKEHGTPPDAVKLLRLRLIVEEYGELAHALSLKVPDHDEESKVGKKVLVADALADLGYVLIGTAITCGISFDQQWSKMEPKETRDKHSLSNWVIPNGPISTIAISLGDFAVGLHEGDLNKIETNLIWMFSATYGTALLQHIPYEAVFAEVHRSNMTKATAAEKNNLQSGQKYGGFGEKTGKGPHWSPPAIRELLGQAR